MYITRRPDPDERERAILWSDPDRDARTRERLSRSPTRRAEAESMVIHSEPTKPDVYVGKRWVSHRDLPEKRRERSLSPLSREIGKKCEPLSPHRQPAIPAPAFSGGRETTRVTSSKSLRGSSSGEDMEKFVVKSPLEKEERRCWCTSVTSLPSTCRSSLGFSSSYAGRRWRRGRRCI